jgi:hypothetical protein
MRPGINTSEAMRIMSVLSFDGVTSVTAIRFIGYDIWRPRGSPFATRCAGELTGVESGAYSSGEVPRWV